MKGDCERGDELITVKWVLNPNYIGILREMKVCGSIINVCHSWDLLVDELSMNQEKEVLQEATRLVEKAIYAQRHLYK